MPRGQRSLQREILSPRECGELIFIHKALCAAGYSPHLWTTKLGDVAYAEPQLLLPLISARDRVLASAEAALGYELEFCVEFTGLVSWTKGAAIQWHHDSNRPHLKQRVATAVVYLNSAEEFHGGQLQFESGSLRHVDAEAGTMVAFMADVSNVHRVTPVTEGERITLTLWFTLQPEHCEDTVVLRQLTSDSWTLMGRTPPDSLYQDCGSDVRHARLAAIGLEWVPLTLPPCESSTCLSEGSSAAEQTATSPWTDPASQSGHIRCRQLEGRGPDDCGCGGIGERKDSLSMAMLSTAWHQWRFDNQKTTSHCPCNHSPESREWRFRYLSAIRLMVPKAIEDWRAAGKLYNLLAM